MGMIAAVTPRLTITEPVPKMPVSSQALIDKAKIELHIPKQQISQTMLKYETLKPVAEIKCELTCLWNCTWLLKPQRPLWNGFMQAVHKEGVHPGPSTVVFLPMIDLSASDKICILSTKEFVAKQADELNIAPILTFDQPLYQKAIEIQMNKSESSALKNIVLRLGGLHTCMSFLGSIGHLMSFSGLQQVLKIVYAENSVPHMELFEGIT